MSRKIHRKCVVEKEPVNIVTILGKNKPFKAITGSEPFGPKVRAALKDAKPYNPDADSYVGFGGAPRLAPGAGDIIKAPEGYGHILNPGFRETSKKTNRYARHMFKSKRKGRKHHPKVNEETVAKYHKMKKGSGVKTAARPTVQRPGPNLGVLVYSSPFGIGGGQAQLGDIYNKAKLALHVLLGNPIMG